MVKKSKELTPKKVKEVCLYLLAAVPKHDVPRLGKSQRILSVYKSQEDCDVIIDEHRKRGENEWGFKLGLHEDFEVLEVPREKTFGILMPSWEEEINRLEEMFSEMVSEITPHQEENEEVK